MRFLPSSETRELLYRRRLDRVLSILLALGCGGVVLADSLGLFEISMRALLRIALVALGWLLLAVAIQSSRAGFLTLKIERQLQEAVPVQLLRNHREIHEAEEEVLLGTPYGSRFWLTNLWFRRRDTASSEEYSSLVKSIQERLRVDREINIRSAVSISDRENWPQLVSSIEGIFGRPNAHIQYYFQNPLAVDCVLGQNSAVLSFPAASNDRDFALVINDEETTALLRDWYEEQLWHNSDVLKQEVRGPDDLARVLDMLDRVWRHEEDPRSQFDDDL